MILIKYQGLIAARGMNRGLCIGYLREKNLVEDASKKMIWKIFDINSYDHVIKKNQDYIFLKNLNSSLILYILPFSRENF